MKKTPIRCLCPVRDCPEGRKPVHLMCLRHWRRVPRALRMSVFAAVDAYYNGKGTLAVLRAAQAEAIAAVEAKEAAAAQPEMAMSNSV